ncbi:hypothetical protein [Streptomyces sp. NPDC002156]
MNVVIRDELVASFKFLREGTGLTAIKLKSHPLLLHLLGVDIPPEGVTKLVLSPEDSASLIATLDKMSMLIDDENQQKAVRSALALGYDPRTGPDERRRQIAKSGPHVTAEIARSERQVRRYEEKGFETLADIIIKNSSALLGKQQDASADPIHDPPQLPPSTEEEEPTNEEKFKKFLWSLVDRYSDRATIGADACLALVLVLGLISGALIMKEVSPDKNDLISDALKERYARLESKPPGSINPNLAKVEVAVSGQSSADDSHGWGPKRRAFTMKKPAPYPVLNSITDHDQHGDERNFVQCRDRENAIWSTEVTARDDHTYQCYIWFDNAVAPNLNDGNSAAKLHDTRVRVRLPVNKSNTPSLVGILSAADSMTVWASCTFTSSQPVTITYQRGSARVHVLPYDNTPGPPQLAETFNGDTATSGITTPSGTLLGENKLDGVIGQNAGYVLFDVKVKLG